MRALPVSATKQARSRGKGASKIKLRLRKVGADLHGAGEMRGRLIDAAEIEFKASQQSKIPRVMERGLRLNALQLREGFSELAV